MAARDKSDFDKFVISKKNAGNFDVDNFNGQNVTQLVTQILDIMSDKMRINY